MQTLTDFRQGDGAPLLIDGVQMNRGASWIDETAHGHDGQARVVVVGPGLKTVKHWLSVHIAEGILVRCSGCMLSWVITP